jgi:starvation-inducible DNA-binding protein
MNNLISLLEKYQATAHVVALNLHNLHWNLEDHLFFTLHPYLGDLYEQINDFEDEIAEQIRFFGQRPVTSLNDINHLSMVDDMASKSFSGQEAINSALEDIQILYKTATEVVKEADSTDVWAAVEKFSGHLVALEKIIYFLRSSKI